MYHAGLAILLLVRLYSSRHAMSHSTDQMIVELSEMMTGFHHIFPVVEPPPPPWVVLKADFNIAEGWSRHCQSYQSANGCLSNTVLCTAALPELQVCCRLPARTGWRREAALCLGQRFTSLQSRVTPRIRCLFLDSFVVPASHDPSSPFKGINRNECG